MKAKRCYFDYAASTPVDPAVEKAMKPYWSGVFGNPGALHSFGQEASAAVFKARDLVAKALGCDYKEIVFTGSATEANNLALRGVVKRIMNKELRIKGEKRNSIIHDSKFIIPKIIVSAIEHESVLDTARDLEREGVEVVYLPVSKKGIVDLKALEGELDERTILVSVMYANNEIGTIQPIAEIANMIRNFRNSKHEARNSKQTQNYKNKIQNVSDFDIRISNFETMRPLFHCDAVQAFNYLPCKVDELGIDLLTLSSQKIYGPKGVGLLYIRRSTKHEARSTKQIQNSKSQNVSNFDIRISDLQLVSPIVTGGGQEFGFRSGTENVPGIVGFAKAMEIAEKLRNSENKRLSKLRDYFISRLKKKIPKAQLNGGLKKRLPNNINIHIPGVIGQELIIKLDLAGFAVSPGSACSARVCKPSHVLKAMGSPDGRAANSLRVSFGRGTKKRDMDKLLRAVVSLV